MKYLLMAFIALQIADIWTTHKCLQRPDRKEANKVIAWLMSKMGVLPALIALKVPIICAVGYVTLCLSVPWWPIALVMLCVFYAAVVVNNIRLLRT